MTQEERFRSWLRKQMKKYKINGKQAAKICGVGKNTITNWRQGHSLPRLDSLFLLTDAMGIDLFKEDDDNAG